MNSSQAFLWGYPFLFIKNKRLIISSEGFFGLVKKNRDMFSEGNAAHPVRCDSPLQIVMAVWRIYFILFELAGSCVTALQIVMAGWRTSSLKKVRQTISICRGKYHPAICLHKAGGLKGAQA
jgi:hypothetical protein